MDNKVQLTAEEKRVFDRMIEYFMRTQHRELWELKSAGGNPHFIPVEEEMLQVLTSIKTKVAVTLG